MSSELKMGSKYIHCFWQRLISLMMSCIKVSLTSHDFVSYFNLRTQLEEPSMA